jgi:hypothetical protein
MRLYSLLGLRGDGAKHRARILKHLVEAEKSTFRGELPFQRSERTAGLTMATVFFLHFLEALNTHFQINRHFKMFKNSGSDHSKNADDISPSLLISSNIHGTR